MEKPSRPENVYSWWNKKLKDLTPEQQEIKRKYQRNYHQWRQSQITSWAVNNCSLEKVTAFDLYAMSMRNSYGYRRRKGCTYYKYQPYSEKEIVEMWPHQPNSVKQMFEKDAQKANEVDGWNRYITLPERERKQLDQKAKRHWNK